MKAILPPIFRSLTHAQMIILASSGAIALGATCLLALDGMLVDSKAPLVAGEAQETDKNPGAGITSSRLVQIGQNVVLQTDLNAFADSLVTDQTKSSDQLSTSHRSADSQDEERLVGEIATKRSQIEHGNIQTRLPDLSDVD